MPLVKSHNDDEAFLQEVASHMSNDFTRMREHAIAMMEEYLRSRIEHEHNILREQFEKEKNELELARMEVDHKVESLSLELRRALSTLSRLCNGLTTERTKHTLIKCFHLWREYALRQKSRHSIAVLLSKHHERERIRDQAYWPWRLFATVRRCQHQSDVHLKAAHDEAELILRAKHEVEQQVLLERQKCEELKQKYTNGFVDGVSALNRTAINVLHGDDDNNRGKGNNSNNKNRELIGSNEITITMKEKDVECNWNNANIGSRNEEDVAAIAAILRRQNNFRPNVLIDNNKNNNRCRSNERIKHTSNKEEVIKNIMDERNDDDDDDDDDKSDYDNNEELAEKKQEQFRKFEKCDTNAVSIEQMRNNTTTLQMEKDSTHVHKMREAELYATRGICPVHFTDSNGNFYHRCFADPIMTTTISGNNNNNNMNGVEMSHGPSAHAQAASHQPFVVRPDVENVRCVNTISSRNKKGTANQSKQRMHFK